MKIIDIHTHGIAGIDTNTDSEENILKIAEIKGEHGTTEIIPTIYPSTIKTMRENMGVIKRAMEIQKSRDESDPDRSEAKIIGIHLEGPFLNPVKCGSLEPGSFLRPNEFNLMKLIEGYEDVIKIITIAPELEKSPSVIKYMSDMGIIASMGHSNATYAEAETGFKHGARGITHIFNAMRGIHHREPGMAGFGLMNKDVYIEVVADPFHLGPQVIEFIFSAKNPDRIIIVSDTVKDAKTTSGPDGITDENERLQGGSMTIKESADRLIDMGLDEEIVMRSISSNPERYLG